MPSAVGVASGVVAKSGGTGFVALVTVGVETTVVFVAGAAVLATGELRGAPTGMSQRCLGWPCGGFMPGGVTVVVVAFVVVGFCTAVYLYWYITLSFFSSLLPT